MAEIEEYTPQVEAQGGVGSTSPNLELAGSVGRAVERLGGAIEEGGQYIQQRKAQEETADVYAKMADQREFWTNEVQQRAQNGTLDTDKIKDDYDNATSSIGDNISTAQGKNYFERQQARVKSHVLQMAQASAAQMASAQAKGAFETGMNKDSSTLMSDPTAFEDVYNGGLESVDQLIKTGGLPEKMRDKAVQQMSSQYAMAAMKGWTDNDPDTARKMLPELGKFMNVAQKEQAERQIDMADRANDADDARADRAEEKAKKAGSEKWLSDNFEKLQNGALPAKDVTKAVSTGIISEEKGQQLINVIRKDATEDLKSDPSVYTDLVKRIADPQANNPIVSLDDVMPYVARGDIAVDGPHSLATIRKLMDTTPEGHMVKQGEKLLFRSATSTIRYKNPMTQQYDMAGESKLAQFMTDYAQERDTIRASGGKLSDLTNPSSPLYFGRPENLAKYQTSWQDQAQGIHQDRTDKALGLEDGQTPKDKAVRKKDESAADYLKRIGK